MINIITMTSESEITQPGSEWRNHAQFFNAPLVPPLVLVRRSFRTESEYGDDPDPKKTAVGLLMQFLAGIPGDNYLLIAGQSISSPSALRSKRGLLSNEKGLREQEHRAFEVKSNCETSRLGALVCINEFKSATDMILNSLYSMIVLSPLTIDALAPLVNSWISLDEKSIIPFNFTSVAKCLSSLPTTALIRYFPADNGRDEQLVVIGHEVFVEDRLKPYLDLVKC